MYFKEKEIEGIEKKYTRFEEETSGNYLFEATNRIKLTERWLIRVAVGWLIVSVFPFILIKSREMLGSTATGTGADQLKSIKPGA